MRHLVLTLSLLLPPLSALPLSAAAQPGRTITAHPRGDAPVRIDGRLDEAIWQQAEETSGFVERTPSPRATPPVDTRFRVLYDGQAVYVGIVLELLPGEVPSALELRRDNFRIYTGDAVTLKFDVGHDRRNTVGFTVNPANNQLDYVAVDNGRTFRAEYDAVWESATSVEEHAWVAELRIPAEALGLSAQEGERILGFNVSRDHNARLATDDWSHMSPEFGPVSALHYGEIRGIDDIAGGRPHTFVPYALLAYPNEDDALTDWPLRLRAGGDVRVRLGADVWSEATLLTDFAQVDLDDQVVNLDRFPLFFPEKRPFFLNGLDVFEFGERGTSQLFFSRRIGLDADGAEIPLLGGIKLYGRADWLSLGVLDVLTADPLTNHGVARVRANFGEASYVGVMATFENRLGDARAEEGEEPQERAGFAVGIDGTVRALDERLELSGSIAATEEAVDSLADDASAFARLRYRTDTLRPELSILHVGDDFAPDLGFVRRNGIVRGSFSLPVVLRPENMRFVTITASSSLTANDELDRRLGADADLAVRARYDAWGFQLSAGFSEDVVEEAFDLLDEIPIAAGTYRGVSVEYELFSVTGRNPNGSISYRASSAFFGGVVHSVTAIGGLSLGSYARLTLTANQSVLDLPDVQSTPTLTVNSALTLTPSTRLAMDLIFQVNDVSEQTVSLARLRWRYLPGSDLFLVYRQALAFDGEHEERLTLKATFRYDALL